MKLSKPVQWTLFAVALLAVGYAGIRAGIALRGRTTPVTAAGPRLPFQPGDSLPDVQLADSSGAAVHSRDLIVGSGTIVLFLDPTCKGCLAMSQRWEQAIKDGVVTADRVIGISRDGAEANQRFRTQHGLQFPIYQDVKSAYLQQHAVTTYPLEIVVGTSGIIQSISEDSKGEMDADRLRSLMIR